MEQKLHTPKGVKDLYPEECEKKAILRESLLEVIRRYGYKDIETPEFEYLDLFRKDKGYVASGELYKFFERHGKCLVLRPDITPSVARAAASINSLEKFPVRFCYAGNTFVNKYEYHDQSKENTQIGAELIGITSEEVDAELIAIAIDCLKKTELIDFSITIGHTDFVRSLLKSAKLSNDIREEIEVLLRGRNYFGLDEILSTVDVDPSVKRIFHKLSNLTGDVSVLKEAEKYAIDDRAKKALRRLQKVYDILSIYGCQHYVTFDLGLYGEHSYYSGIVFHAHTYKTKKVIMRGGRYDYLLGKLGKAAPAAGFSIMIDDLLRALDKQKIPIETSTSNIIVYSKELLKTAIYFATRLRANGKHIEMLKISGTHTKEEYVAYAKRTNAMSLLYMNDGNVISLTNLETGAEKLIDISEKTSLV